MLSAIVKESQAKQAKIRANNDRNRKEALAATESVSNLMTESVQESVNEVYGAQNKLEKEVKGLQTNTAHFAKQTYQWLEMIKAFNGSLKECGDFQNWAKTVEWDMKNIASALDYVQREDAAGFAAAQPAAT